jgi:uncharacterized repeat protein (TIGR03806 family)
MHAPCAAIDQAVRGVGFGAVQRERLMCAALLLVCGCGVDDGIGDAGMASSQPESLAELGLFSDAIAQTPAEGVLPYDVNAVLYADESEKLRFMAIPKHRVAVYDALSFWDFPDGTRFVKTFFYYHDARDPSRGRTLLETRIIERTSGSWTGRTYVWNTAQTEARRYKVGKTMKVHWIDRQGAQRTQDYRVPNDNECKTCHSKSHKFEPLGPRTRQLNREHDYGSAEHPDLQNQIDHWSALGLIKGDIGDAVSRFSLVDPYGAEPLERRARSYLDANCSHCHRPGGEAGSTALDLRAETTDLFGLGVCRTPVAAGPGSGGRNFDIVPGDPDASILVFRMESTDPQLKMPELPTLTSDAAGTALIRAWIASMPTTPGCNE